MSETKPARKSSRLVGTFHLALQPFFDTGKFDENQVAKDFLACPRVKSILSHIQNLKGIKNIASEHAHDVCLIFTQKMIFKLDDPLNVYSVIYRIAQLHARTVYRQEDVVLGMQQDLGEETLEQLVSRVESSNGSESFHLDNIEDQMDHQAHMTTFASRLAQVGGWPSGINPRDKIKTVKAPGRRRNIEQTGTSESAGGHTDKIK